MERMKCILSSANKKRTLRVAIRPSIKAVKIIDKVLTKLEPKNTYFEAYNQETGEDEWIYDPKSLRDRTMGFFRDEETGFIIFKEKHIEFILLKDSKRFKEIETELFNVFDFVSYK